MVSSMTLHSQPPAQPAGNHAALLTVTSAVAPLLSLTWTGLPIWPIGNGGGWGVGSAELLLGDEQPAAMMASVAASTRIPMFERIGLTLIGFG